MDKLPALWASPIRPYGKLWGSHAAASINIIFYSETWSVLFYTVMHWICAAFCIIHQTYLTAESGSKTSKINILPVMWQCAMHQILLCAQRIISQQRIISEWPHGGGSGRCDCWVMFLLWPLSQWPDELQRYANLINITACAKLIDDKDP